MQSRITRREFVQTSSLVTAAALSGGLPLPVATAADDAAPVRPFLTPADKFRDAVKGKSWPAAAKALNEVPEGDVQALLKPLAAKELDLLDAASDKLKDLPLALRIRTHRHIVPDWSEASAAN